MSQTPWWQLSPRLPLFPSIFLADTFFPLFPFSLTPLCLLLSPSLLPFLPSPAYITETAWWQRGLAEDSSTLNRNPPSVRPSVHPSPRYLGSYDSRALDHKQREIMAREIKAEKDNTYTHTLCSPSRSVPHTLHPSDSLDSQEMLFNSKRTQKVQSDGSVLIFFMFFDYIHWMIYWAQRKFYKSIRGCRQKRCQTEHTGD